MKCLLWFVFGLNFFLSSGNAINLKFGDPCSISDEINGCDLQAGLSCNSNTDKCECEFTWQVFDMERGICLSPLDQTCNNEIFRCIENAECKEDEQLLPICVCQDGTVPVESSRYCPWGMIVAGHSETGTFRICCSTNNVRNPAYVPEQCDLSQTICLH
ncbi:unnamed protein product [Allacma fusca]|uniref:Uncharacterized protein n=1 Tax=Allacma fusca TaxID=39272 RepID=A0A8J2K893_9HEXA|nr:unnamed protein product [Allacma fusca]